MTIIQFYRWGIWSLLRINSLPKLLSSEWDLIPAVFNHEAQAIDHHTKFPLNGSKMQNQQAQTTCHLLSPWPQGSL